MYLVSFIIRIYHNARSPTFTSRSVKRRHSSVQQEADLILRLQLTQDIDLQFQ